MKTGSLVRPIYFDTLSQIKKIKAISKTNMNTSHTNVNMYFEQMKVRPTKKREVKRSIDYQAADASEFSHRHRLHSIDYKMKAYRSISLGLP